MDRIVPKAEQKISAEQRDRDIVTEELARLGVDIPVFASVDYYPSRKESHRMNTTILEAYAAEPSRQTLKKVSDRFKKHGAKFDLRVMATHGGTISWKAKELARKSALNARAKEQALTVIAPLAFEAPKTARSATGTGRSSCS